MKVVINKCFGGFGISTEAMKLLVIRGAKCMRSCTPKEYYGGNSSTYRVDNWQERWVEDYKKYKDIGDGFMAHKWGYNIYKDELLWDLNDSGDPDIRMDKDLVIVVESLKDKVNGTCANLQIVEIPDGVKFGIADYDGMESIHEVHRSW